jgi:protease I
MATRIAVLLTNKFEDPEASEPIEALKKEGMEPVVVSPEAGETLEGKQGKVKIKSDLAITEASPSDFEGLLLPGGRSPEALRGEKGAVEFVRHFVDKKKPIASICHGAQLLMSADGLRGKKMTCVSSIAVDAKNAGADYVDEEVVVDGNLVTSRVPDDIPAFNREMIKLFKQAPVSA